MLIIFTLVILQEIYYNLEATENLAKLLINNNMDLHLKYKETGI